MQVTASKVWPRSKLRMSPAWMGMSGPSLVRAMAAMCSLSSSPSTSKRCRRWLRCSPVPQATSRRVRASGRRASTASVTAAASAP